ncbi:MAG: hypothetical protein KBB88_01385 [Candidatus Pacebacteria bacterium]|nr:hypothetical protein [Candidatus Paceibacterota bacterium]
MAFYINACEGAGGVATSSQTGPKKKGDVASQLKTFVEVNDKTWVVACDADNNGTNDTTTWGYYTEGWTQIFEYAVNACEDAGGVATTSGGKPYDTQTEEPGVK